MKENKVFNKKIDSGYVTIFIFFNLLIFRKKGSKEKREEERERRKERQRERDIM